MIEKVIWQITVSIMAFQWINIENKYSFYKNNFLNIWGTRRVFYILFSSNNQTDYSLIKNLEYRHQFDNFPTSILGILTISLYLFSPNFPVNHNTTGTNSSKPKEKMCKICGYFFYKQTNRDKTLNIEHINVDVLV